MLSKRLGGEQLFDERHMKIIIFQSKKSEMTNRAHVEKVIERDNEQAT